MTIDLTIIDIYSLKQFIISMKTKTARAEYRL